VAGLLAELLAGGVELVNLTAQPRQDHHCLRRVALGVLEGLPPVRQQGLLELAGGLGGHQPPMLAVGGHGLVDVAVAHRLQRLAFPGLLLAAVLAQHTRAKAEPQAAEAAAGLDGGKLPVVAHQHHLGAGSLGVVEQPGELAAAEHAGLVHHQHRAGIQQRHAAIAPSAVTSGGVQLGEQPVTGGDVLEPFGAKAHGRDPGGGGADHAGAVELPGVAGRPPA
jgi:hypothetical protein